VRSVESAPLPNEISRSVKRDARLTVCSPTCLFTLQVIETISKLGKNGRVLSCVAGQVQQGLGSAQLSQAKDKRYSYNYVNDVHQAVGNDSQIDISFALHNID